MNRKMYILVLLVFTVLMLVSGYFLVSWLFENKKSDNIRNTEEEHLTIEKDNYYLNPAILKDNPETVGWLIVPGTKINYPVVQHNDNDYYLNHDFKRNFNSAGWVFMDYNNKLDDQNIVIYGHHRHDDSMFGSIDLLFDKEFYKNNANEIIFVTEKEVLTYTIFSVYKASVKDIYNQPNYNNLAKKIDKFKKNSQINFKEEINENSQIITISTCSANNIDRLVVHGYRKK